MKDISIGGIVILDRAELGAEEEEQVSFTNLLFYYVTYEFDIRLWNLWRLTRDLDLVQRKKGKNQHLLSPSYGQRIKLLSLKKYMCGF